VQHENQRIESVSRFFCQSAKLLVLLVDLIGIEPMTSSMPWKRAPSCATGPHCGRLFFIFFDRCRFVKLTTRKIGADASKMVISGLTATILTLFRIGNL
jgi:hypothetical protein